MYSYYSETLTHNNNNNNNDQQRRCKCNIENVGFCMLNDFHNNSRQIFLAMKPN